MEEMEPNKKYVCRSVFVHNAEDRREAFTKLWSQLITEKENADICQNEVLHTSISGL